MDKSILGNNYMEMTGRHFQGLRDNQDIDKAALERAQLQAVADQQAYAEAMMNKDKDCKPIEGKKLCPCNSVVIVLPYEKNPYRQPLHKTASGLILGDMESTSFYKSNETGELESAERGIWCCKVIAVGEACKYVKEGDDVYLNFRIVNPVPFGGLGYYAVSEQNIICAVR